jgi:hypothetical protein
MGGDGKPIKRNLILNQNKVIWHSSTITGYKSVYCNNKKESQSSLFTAKTNF